VDAGYRGEVKVVMINLGKEPFVIKQGMKIAQLLVQPVTAAEVTGSLRPRRYPAWGRRVRLDGPLLARGVRPPSARLLRGSLKSTVLCRAMGRLTHVLDFYIKRSEPSGPMMSQGTSLVASVAFLLLGAVRTGSALKT